MAQRDLGFEGVLVQFGDVQEQLDRLVRLLVEQVVQAAEISGGKLADLAVAMAFATAAPDHPAAERPDRQQQPEPDPLVEEGPYPGYPSRRRLLRNGSNTLSASN